MKLFKNKSIAVVGNAESLFKKNLGSTIDSYDIVCRFNFGANIKNTEQQGSKTNIVFVNGLESQLPNFKTTTIHTTLKHRVNGKSKICDYEIPVEYNEELIKLCRVDRPSSGIMALHYISKLSPSSVGIFGFDFKQTKTFYHDKNMIGPHNWEREKDYINKNLKTIKNWKLY